jgi:hypothetical protein
MTWSIHNVERSEHQRPGQQIYCSSSPPDPSSTGSRTHPMMTERDQVGIILLAVFIPSIVIAALLWLCHHKSPSSKETRWNQTPPHQFNHQAPHFVHVHATSTPIPAPLPPVVVAPVPVAPSQTASVLAPTLPRSQQGQGSFAEEAEAAAHLSPFAQDNLLNANGAMVPASGNRATGSGRRSASAPVS